MKLNKIIKHGTRNKWVCKKLIIASIEDKMKEAFEQLNQRCEWSLPIHYDLQGTKTNAVDQNEGSKKDAVVHDLRKTKALDWVIK